MAQTLRKPWAGFSRRAAVISSAVVAVLVASVAAYAWVNATGTGAGHATTGDPLQRIDVVGPANIQLELGTPVALSGSFINENSFTVSVARVTVSVTGISPSNGPTTGSCSIAPGVNFTTTDAVPPAGQRFTVGGASSINGTGSGDWSGATIVFRNNPTADQSACLGRRLNLKYKALAN
jgi:hypothetical protein